MTATSTSQYSAVTTTGTRDIHSGSLQSTNKLFKTENDDLNRWMTYSQWRSLRLHSNSTYWVSLLDRLRLHSQIYSHTIQHTHHNTKTAVLTSTSELQWNVESINQCLSVPLLRLWSKKQERFTEPNCNVWNDYEPYVDFSFKMNWSWCIAICKLAIWGQAQRRDWRNGSHYTRRIYEFH